MELASGNLSEEHLTLWLRTHRITLETKLD